MLQAYKTIYSASLFCLEHGGRLAEQVHDHKSAIQHCHTIRGELLIFKGKVYRSSSTDDFVRPLYVIQISLSGELVFIPGQTILTLQAMADCAFKLFFYYKQYLLMKLFSTWNSTLAVYSSYEH